MSRYFYYLHRYSLDSRPLATFTSRKQLCNCMRNLPFSPAEFEDKFFLHVIAPKYTAIYNFKAHDGCHLSAVLSRRLFFRGF